MIKSCFMSLTHAHFSPLPQHSFVHLHCEEEPIIHTYIAHQRSEGKPLAMPPPGMLLSLILATDWLNHLVCGNTQNLLSPEWTSDSISSLTRGSLHVGLATDKDSGSLNTGKLMTDDICWLSFPQSLKTPAVKYLSITEHINLLASSVLQSN